MTRPMSSSSALAAVIETALNGYLALDPEVRSRCAALDGSVIAMQLKGLALTLYFLPTTDRIDVLGHYEGKPDTLLTGTPASLFRLAVVRSEEQLFNSGVEFHGDTEKGERFRDILASVDIDWEELLSRVTGDAIAHQMGNVARSLTATATQGLTSLQDDVSEYLREESRLVPTAIEVNNLLEEIDTVRLDTDRLEARIQRLEKLHKDTS